MRRKIDANYDEFYQEKFENQPFYLIADETQIFNRRFVNVLIGILGVSNECFLIIKIEIFKSPNSKNIGIIIEDVIKDFLFNRKCFYL